MTDQSTLRAEHRLLAVRFTGELKSGYPGKLCSGVLKLLSEIAWEDILFTPILIIMQPQTWLTFEGCWIWPLKARKGCCRIRNCQYLHVQSWSVRSILNKWVTTAGLGLWSRKIPQPCSDQTYHLYLFTILLWPSREVCCLWPGGERQDPA